MTFFSSGTSPPPNAGHMKRIKNFLIDHPGIAGFAVLAVLYTLWVFLAMNVDGSSSGECYVDWDGRSNPLIC